MVVPGKLICRARMAGTYLTVLLAIAALIFGCSVKGPTPTPDPESAPAPSTGSAPTDPPTSIPADSPTPIPTVLPTVAPPYFEAWQSIDDALWLEQNRPAWRQLSPPCPGWRMELILRKAPLCGHWRTLRPYMEKMRLPFCWARGGWRMVSTLMKQ